MNKKTKILLVCFFALVLALPAIANKTRWWNPDTLIGGCDTCLDAIDGQALDSHSRAAVITTDATYFYYVDTDSGASESTPDVIKPDSNAGDKRWLLSPVYTP